MQKNFGDLTLAIVTEEKKACTLWSSVQYLKIKEYILDLRDGGEIFFFNMFKLIHTIIL